MTVAWFKGSGARKQQKQARCDADFKGGAVTLQEASAIFGATKDALKKMSKQQLVRLFRRRAQGFHPDKGGDREKFIELTHAYLTLFRTKND